MKVVRHARHARADGGFPNAGIGSVRGSMQARPELYGLGPLCQVR